MRRLLSICLQSSETDAATDGAAETESVAVTVSLTIQSPLPLRRPRQSLSQSRRQRPFPRQKTADAKDRDRIFPPTLPNAKQKKEELIKMQNRRKQPTAYRIPNKYSEYGSCIPTSATQYRPVFRPNESNPLKLKGSDPITARDHHSEYGSRSANTVSEYGIPKLNTEGFESKVPRKVLLPDLSLCWDLSFACFLAFASPSFAAETLWQAKPKEEKAVVAPPTPAHESSNQKPQGIGGPKPKRSVSSSNGNLPMEIQSRASLAVEPITLAIVTPAAGAKSSIPGFEAGMRLTATIPHGVIAFPDEKTPVLAEVESPEEFKGARLLGEARLERNTQRIFIDLTRIVMGPKTTEIKAQAFTMEGELGLEGKYRSREAWYFTGDFISSTVAAYFDGLIPRTTNVFGQPLTDISVDSAIKKGAAAGAMASAERFREKLKKVPEFCEMKGPSKIGVLLL